MKETNSNQNQKQPKTLEEALEEAKVSEVLMETSKIYDSYVYKVGEALIRIIKKAPQAAEEYIRVVENLQKWGECKSFLTRDKNALQKCRDEYNFRDGLMEGINEYLYYILVRTPEEIKEFTEALKFLAEEQVIDHLYKLYQEVKKLKLEYLSEVNKYNQMSPEDLDRRLYETSSESVKSLIFQYLENPKGRKEQFMKYLGYTSLEDADIAACRLYGGCKTEKQNT
ncbi:MAG: hypothetical protein RXN31_01020 [Candidatus Nanopusillus acidilobi]